MLPRGRTIAWNSDANGRPTGAVYPEATTSFGYVDATSRIMSITRMPSTGLAQRLDQDYDSFLQTGVRFTGAAQGDFRYSYGRELLLRASP